MAKGNKRKKKKFVDKKRALDISITISLSFSISLSLSLSRRHKKPPTFPTGADIPRRKRERENSINRLLSQDEKERERR